MLECSHPLSSFEQLYDTRDYISKDRFQVGLCHACGLYVTTPVPDADELGAYYPMAYYGTGNRFAGLVEQFLGALYAHRADRITQLRPRRVLDIGCGRGLLLNELRKRGWNVQGTELSEDAARYAREQLALPVETTSVLDAQFPAEAFDLVVLWHVLEHLYSPHAVLAEVARILKPGGTLLVAVPNFGSWEARATRDHWFHLDVPRHLAHFTDQQLMQLLQQDGLSVQKASYFSAEFDFFSCVQSAQNALGLHHNLLYNLLRTRSAKVLARGRRPGWYWPVHLAFTGATLLPLAALSLGYVPAAGLLRKGATVTVAAVKSGSSSPREGLPGLDPTR